VPGLSHLIHPTPYFTEKGKHLLRDIRTADVRSWLVHLEKNPPPVLGRRIGGRTGLSDSTLWDYLMGACDADCSNLDLTLYDGNGNVVDSDLLDDDAPVLSVTGARLGAFHVRVSSTSMRCCGGVGARSASWRIQWTGSTLTSGPPRVRLPPRSWRSAKPRWSGKIARREAHRGRSRAQNYVRMAVHLLTGGRGSEVKGLEKDDLDFVYHGVWLLGPSRLVPPGH
jgi:hypothetical protein